MLFVQLRQSLLLVTVFFVGCSYPQNKVVMKSENQDKVIFDGEYIEVIESVQSNLEQIPFDSKENEFCFQGIEAVIKDKLSGLGFKGNTKYFAFNSQKKFTLKLNKEQSAKISLDSVKKLDSNAGVTDSNELYLIKNEDHEYLLLTGHNIGTSGIGHYYRYHTLVPLNSNRPILEFDSILSEPRKIKIDDSGVIYYTQIDSVDFGAVKNVGSNNFPVIVSLFTFDGASNKKFEFSYDCKNWEQR